MVAIVVVDDVAEVGGVVVVVVSSAPPPHAATTSVKTPSIVPSRTFFISISPYLRIEHRASATTAVGRIGFPVSPTTGSYTMAIIESRIDLVDLICEGCDCGQCVSQSLEVIGRMHSVEHVRVDRLRTQIVVRHEQDGVSFEQLSSVVQSKGLQMVTKGQSSPLS